MEKTNILTNNSVIDGVEFINLQPIDKNPLMSSCEIKVFYLGENRNGNFISKETALKMAKTIRGCPIVGYFREEKQDFGDHGERIVIDCDGIKTECLTMPYGFVSPDAQVYFKKFIETNGFGEEVEREYLLTTGYLWTGQFPEIKDAITEGRPQSMELRRDSLDGHWSKNSRGKSFFIINDATLSKLCILGSDVEPCFEGAEVTLTEKYQYQDINFVNTLFAMAKELRQILKGDDFTVDTKELEAIEEVVEKNAQVESDESFQAETEVEEPIAQEEPEVEPVEETEVEPEGETDVETDPEPTPAEDFSKEREQYELKIQELTEKINSLSTAFEELEKTSNKYKEAIEAFENKEKDSIVDKFSALLDAEEMKEVVDNKQSLSCAEIESRLSVLFSRKTIEKQESEVPTTEVTFYTMNTDDQINAPEWVKALEEQRKGK